MTQLVLTLQKAIQSEFLPKRSDFKQWLMATLKDRNLSAEICIRIVDAEESATLNQQYRNKPYPTNILSFPYQDEFNANDQQLIGDLVICAKVVEKEAQAQNKEVIAHWAHLVIHGTLHLLGYDHQVEEEAEIMENLEITILQKLDYANPYV